MNNITPIPTPSEEPGRSRAAIVWRRCSVFISGIAGKHRYLVAEGRTTTGKGLFPRPPVRSGFVSKMLIKISCMKTGVLKEWDWKNPIRPEMTEELLQKS